MKVKQDEIDLQKRCFLRKATAAAGGIGLAAAAVPFLSYWLPSDDAASASAPITIDISQLTEGQQLTVPWRGMPIWIIARTKAMLETLPKLESHLRDPLSDENQQPNYCQNQYRSIKPEYFVSIGICTHLGCVPTFRPDIGGISPDWLGGFYCPCHGSKYDLAGRVYQNVPAPLNLKIPKHMYLSDKEILLGKDESGEEGVISIG